MAYGVKNPGEMLLKVGADATQRNRAGVTCYEGIDVKARAAGSEIAGPEHTANTTPDLAAIKAEELNTEIKKLTEQIAEEENRRVIAVDDVHRDLVKVKPKADKCARELEKTVAELEVVKKAAAAHRKSHFLSPWPQTPPVAGGCGKSARTGRRRSTTVAAPLRAQSTSTRRGREGRRRWC